jgi:hypothetical protein
VSYVIPPQSDAALRLRIEKGPVLRGVYGIKDTYCGCKYVKKTLFGPGNIDKNTIYKKAPS